MSGIINSNPHLSEEKKTYLIAKDLEIFYFQKKIISKMNFSLQPGDCIAVMGPNGTGKSTLFNTFAGLHTMYSGSFTSSCPLPGYLPQRFEGDRTFPLTLEEVVSIAYPEASLHDLHQALKEVKLTEFAACPIACLSVGQFQRMLFARLFLQNRSIFLLDEPFAGMDEDTIYDLLSCLQRWSALGKIVLVAQHNRERARQFFPKTLLLSQKGPFFGPTIDLLGA